MNGTDMGVARLYGGVIAVVSGLYSLWLSSTGMGETTGVLMAVLGLVVLVHGVALFVVPERLGDASGPLMVVWAVLMLLNQAWMATMGGPPMDGGMGMDGGMAPAMGWDVGMVAVAVIMLASGVIMWTSENPQRGM